MEMQSNSASIEADFLERERERFLSSHLHPEIQAEDQADLHEYEGHGVRLKS